MTRQLKNIKQKLKPSSSGKNVPGWKVYGSLYSSWAADSSNVIGFDGITKELNKIVKDGSQTSEDLFIALAIVGIGGSGKTALAQKLSNSFDAKDFDIRIWVSMSRYLYPLNSQKDYKSILLAIFHQLLPPGAEPGSIFMEELEIIKMIRKTLEGRSSLLVLDGVHHIEDWFEDLCYNLVEGEEISSKLSHALPKRSRNRAVIVTTREEYGAEKMVGKKNIYRMERLTNDECWTIFKSSFGEDRYQETLKRMRNDICHDCEGLPLVAKALGTIIRRSDFAT